MITIRRLGQALCVYAAMFLLLECGYRVLLWREPSARRAAGPAFEFYGVGESTLLGEPYQDKMSLLDLVSAMLGGRIGERPIVIRNLAAHGWSIYPEALRFDREAAFRDRSVPGAVLIYAGHNEGFLTDAEDRRLAARIETSWLLRKSWLLRDWWEFARSKRVVEPIHGLRHYEFFLRRVIEDAQNAGLAPVLCTLPSHISGIEPEVPDDPGLRQALLDGAALERAGQYSRARKYYDDLYHQALSAKRGSAAQFIYRRAHCDAALGRYESARQGYWAAVDQDLRTRFGRATTSQNDLLRRLAAQYGIPLVDAAADFEQASPHKILGDHLLADGQHPNLAGYQILAKGVARRLAEAGGVRIEGDLDRLERIKARFGIGAGDDGRALIHSANWLLVTSVDHPWPRDRMAMAEDHCRAALGLGDDRSAYLCIALAQAADRGGLLRQRDAVDRLKGVLTYGDDNFRIAPESWPDLAARLAAAKVDREVLRHLDESAPR